MSAVTWQPRVSGFRIAHATALSSATSGSKSCPSLVVRDSLQAKKLFTHQSSAFLAFPVVCGLGRSGLQRGCLLCCVTLVRIGPVLIGLAEPARMMNVTTSSALADIQKREETFRR